MTTRKPLTKIGAAFLIAGVASSAVSLWRNVPRLPEAVQALRNPGRKSSARKP
jgi:hypothetical protein